MIALIPEAKQWLPKIFNAAPKMKESVSDFIRRLERTFRLAYGMQR